MPAPCDATVIIPQRNHGSLTAACIESLRRWEGENWPIVVVDDGSSDGSPELIELAAIPNCRVLRQMSLGVTAAWNAGIQSVTTPFVVLLNNDVLVDGPVLDELLKPLQYRQALIAGVEWRREPLIPRQLESRFPGRQLLAGWCFSFETELWSQLGGFDESLRLYYSDTDFQCRAAQCLPMASAGRVLSVVPLMPLRHLGHQTSRLVPERASRWQADRARFLCKWEGAAT